MATSLVFSPKLITGAAQTLLLSAFTLLSITSEPWSAVLPVAFILTFPRKKRNAAYMALVSAGALFAWKNGLVRISLPSPVSPLEILPQLVLPVGLLVYSVLSKARTLLGILRNSKGPTPFLTLLLVVLSVVSPFNWRVIPYAVITLTVLSVRLIFHARNSRVMEKKGVLRT